MKQLERMMTQNEAQELVEAINILLKYGRNPSRYTYELIEDGWDIVEINDDDYETGYRVELDADAVLLIDEEEEEGEED